jgi:uncharacterized membrane protein YjdF
MRMMYFPGSRNPYDKIGYFMQGYPFSRRSEILPLGCRD